MVVYNLTNYSDLDEWHPTLALAKASASKHGMPCEVVRHVINKPTKDVVCTLLSGQGFSIESETVYKREEKADKISRTAAEIIAFHIGSDIADVRDARYQPSRFAKVALYTIGDYYYCAPRAGQALPKGYNWVQAGMEYERMIYRAHMNDEGEK